MSGGAPLRHPALFLIGPRAGGKTSLGRALAEGWGWAFEDADAVLEARYGRPIAAWLPEDEAGFRRAEAALLREWLGRERAVLALGGGVVEDAGSVAALAAWPAVVALLAPVEVLVRRQEGSGRPPLTALPLEEEVRGVLERRHGLYERAASGRLLDTAGPFEEILERLDRLASPLCGRGPAGAAS